MEYAASSTYVGGICTSKCGGGYSYFLLLSGQDYPIKPLSYILTFLEREYPKPLIHMEEYEEGTWLATKFMLVKYSHMVENIHNKIKPGLFRKLIVAPIVVAEKLHLAVFGTPYDQLKRLGCTPYGGSTWWILPSGVFEYIMGDLKSNPKLLRIYKKTWTPDETFFQTMTMRSPYANYYVPNDTIYNYEKGDLPSMTYANFITPTKPFRGHPHDITLEDVDRILKKKALFARKFNMETNSDAMDKVDEFLKK